MDKVLETSDGLRFKEKIAILDTFSVPNLIASRCIRTAMRLGSQMTKTNKVKGGGVTDGVGFSPAGKFLCAANYLDSDISMAFLVARRAYVLQNGIIVREGSVEILRDDPALREAYLGGAVKADMAEDVAT